MERIWEAVRFERPLRSGRTKPLLLECERREAGSVARQRFVTKAMGLPEVYAFTLCHEFVGARLARIVGLEAPDAVLINLSTDFLDAARGDLHSAGVQLSAGMAVGSTFIPNLMPFPVEASLGKTEVADAARIYVFDLLVQNADRRVGNPNCGRAAGRIVPYDFGDAFGFRLALSPPEPWRVSALRFAANHLFRNELKALHLNWPEVLLPFAALTPEAVAELCGRLPEGWAAVATEIRAHLETVLAHWAQFSEELAASLGDPV